MNEEPSLEQRLAIDVSANANPAASGLMPFIRRHSKYFVVDGTAYAGFYAPFMTVAECFSPMDAEDIYSSRAVGAVTGFAGGYLCNLIREVASRSSNTNADSSRAKKIVMETAAAVLSVIPYYLALRVIGVPKEEINAALPIGGGVTIGLAFIFGPVNDWWRERFGLQPVVKKI